MKNVSYPFPLFFYPTFRCNYACSYCFTRSGPAEPARSFLLDNWANVIQQAKCLDVPEIRISGGEPLLITEIARLCQTICHQEIRYTIQTNGSCLDRHFDWLQATPPETLWVSFHREYVSTLRFKKRIALAAQKLARVGANVLDKDANPAFLVDLARAGTKRIKVIALSRIGRCGDIEDRASAEHRAPRWHANDIRRLAVDLASAAGEQVELRIELPTVRGGQLGPETCALRRRSLVSIDAAGRAFACCVTVANSAEAIGDLRLESLKDIVTRALRQSSHTLPCERILPKIEYGQHACPLNF